MDRMNKLNHFTTFDSLLKILQNGLKFSTQFDNWEDENDSELIELYNRRHSLQAGVLCFLNDDETIYHWSYFAKNNETKNVCCIEFDKKKIVQAAEAKGCIYQEVQYDTLKEVSFDSDLEMLFTKRWPYRNEREFRIVKFLLPKDCEFLPISDSIKKITLSGKLSDEEFCNRRDDLRKNYKVQCEINHSTVYRNEHWIRKALLFKDKPAYIVNVRNSCHISEEESLQFNSLLEREGHVSMIKFHDLWSKNPIIATISSNGELFAGGALKIPEERYKVGVFEKADSKYDYSKFQYELGWITTEPKYRGTGCCTAIVNKLLEYNGKAPIYTTVREYNITMRKILELNDFCVSGKPFKGNGEYDVLLYIKNM